VNRHFLDFHSLQPTSCVEKVRSQILSLRQLRHSRLFSARRCWHLSLVFAAISDLGSGLLDGRGRPFCSEWLNSLQSFGLRGFRTVLEIRVIRAAYEFHEMGFCRSARAAKSIRFRNHQIEVRFLPPQPQSCVWRQFTTCASPIHAGPVEDRRSKKLEEH
jgi:hypothetical protein